MFNSIVRANTKKEIKIEKFNNDYSMANSKYLDISLKKYSEAFAKTDYFKSVENKDITLLNAVSALSWVYACVYKLATSIATAYFEIYYENEDESLINITNEPEFNVLQNPNPWFTRFDFWEATGIYLESTGKCYWEITPDKKEMYPLNPAYMKPVKHPKKFIK